MRQLKIVLSSFVLFLSSGCAMLQHGDDPNYTLCKTLESKIQFGSNTAYNRFGNTTYTRAAAPDVEKRRLEATYDRLNCSKYQWLKF